jgi:Uma2 family endonuclease
MITKLEQLDPNKTYTYADYLSWKFSERVELLWGKIFKMSPAPSTNHQRISSILHKNIAVFLEQSPREVFHAPFDVHLNLKEVFPVHLREPQVGYEENIHRIY